MQKTHALFPNGLWGIDPRWTNRHWGIIQCDLRKGPPENPTPISTIGYPRRSASEFPNHGRKRQLEAPKSTIELKSEVGDIEFHEIFIVVEHLTGPNFGLMFLQRNHTVLDMRQ